MLFAAAMLISAKLAHAQLANHDDIEDWFAQLSTKSPKFKDNLPVREAVSHADFGYHGFFNETTVDGWYDQLSKSSG